jgi:prepilin-type N-terminal cleavage/methylation domain-containing protein
MKTRNRQRGFTLIELLVVVAVIVVGSALVIPALASANNKSQRTVCMNQVRQQCMALTLFANANNENLPTNTGGYWATDMGMSVQKAMTNDGTSMYTWYDPGIQPRFGLSDFNTLWTWEWPTAGEIGYCQTLAGTASYADYAGDMFSTNKNSKLNATTVADTSGGGTFTVYPASRPLMACANMNQTGYSSIASVESTYNWAQIVVVS